MIAERKSLDRRMRGDDGTALLEFALVVPLLFVLVMGVFEIGFIVKNSLTLTTALRLAARSSAQSSSFAARRWAEYDSLEMFRNLQNELRNTQLVKVIVYKPTDSVGTAPANCLTAVPTYPNANTTPSNCNVYGPQKLADFSNASTKTSRFGATASTATCTTGSGGDWDQSYCTPTRSNSLVTGLDTICIYAEFTYTYFTRVIPGGTRTISDKACAQIEPQ